MSSHCIIHWPHWWKEHLKSSIEKKNPHTIDYVPACVRYSLSKFISAKGSLENVQFTVASAQVSPIFLFHIWNVSPPVDDRNFMERACNAGSQKNPHSLAIRFDPKTLHCSGPASAWFRFGNDGGWSILYFFNVCWSSLIQTHTAHNSNHHNLNCEMILKSPPRNAVFLRNFVSWKHTILSPSDPITPTAAVLWSAC